MDYRLQQQISMCLLETNISVSICMEGRKEIILVDYITQIQGSVCIRMDF